jgi:pantetheine-phosphate adenylyltransferase
MNSCIYPGSFDPVTNGHLDIIQRAANTFDRVVVAVLYNPNKKPFFTVDERIELLKKTTGDIGNIQIVSFSGLLIDFIENKNINVIVKGLRAVSDFEYEFQMALMNKKLSPKVETMFMMTNSKYSYISSSIIKEVAVLNGCIRGLVPEVVEEAIFDKIK